MDAKSGAEQPEDAVGGECNDAEHQVAERLEVAANAEMAATEFILDASIGAFRLWSARCMSDPWGRGF